ncbi:MAG: hypothetical protein Q4D26_11660 [Clostridia bacterium]|nr:hypothetical protein [Clostridia bacterium]
MKQLKLSKNFSLYHFKFFLLHIERKENETVEENLVHSSLDFLKALERFTLESKLLACQKYSSRIMTCSMVDMEKAYTENIMPWEIEAFSAYSIVYNNDDAIEELDKDTFASMITLIRNYWHEGLSDAENNGVYHETFMMISALQQFPVQGLILPKLFRYHYFFTFENDKLDMKKVFADKMGVNYERLEKFAFIVFMCFSKEAQDKSPQQLLKDVLTKAFGDSNVLKLITIEKDEYRNQLSALYGENLVDQYYGLKVQYIYPFISDGNMIYVPSPYLIINAVTESMLNRITFQDDKLRRAFGKEVIESYLYRIISQLDTVTWVSQEIEYKVGKKKKLTSDVIAAESGKIVFYDSKAMSPSLKIRKFDEDEIKKDIEIYAGDIIQIYHQIENFMSGYFTLDKKYERDDIYGIVVVLEDVAVSRKKVYEKVISLLNAETSLVSEETTRYICSHIKILPLRQIEVMVLQNTSLVPSLVFQVDNPECWYDYTYGNSTVENGLIPIYEEYVNDLKTKISSEMT